MGAPAALFGDIEEEETQDEKEKKKSILHKNERNRLEHLRSLTSAMNGLLLDMNRHYKVSQFRVGYALLFFISNFLPYLVFLAFMTYGNIYYIYLKKFFFKLRMVSLMPTIKKTFSLLIAYEIPLKLKASLVSTLPPPLLT